VAGFGLDDVRGHFELPVRGKSQWKRAAPECSGRPFEIFSAVSIIAGWGNSDASGIQIFGSWNERVAGIFEVGGVDRLSGWQSVSPPTQAELGRGTPGGGGICITQG